MNNIAFENSIDWVIEWGDCDPAGIVFYPNYFRMFNMATDRLFKSAGFGLHSLISRFGIIGYPMIETRAAFTTPNRFGETVAIRSNIARWGRSSFEVRHFITNAGGLSVEGFEKRVWAIIGPDGALKGAPVPDDVRSKLLPLTTNSEQL